jgi:NAD(P)-dependent dehydrogenase (short-subunit alcohol dehydrogenase family)
MILGTRANCREAVSTMMIKDVCFNDSGSPFLEEEISASAGYSAASVRSFARGWTMELKDRKIRVNSMSPSPIETPALEKVGLPPEQVEQAIAGFTSQVPLGRKLETHFLLAAVKMAEAAVVAARLSFLIAGNSSKPPLAPTENPPKGHVLSCNRPHSARNHSALRYVYQGHLLKKRSQK